MLDRLEKKIGRYAIKHLTNYLIGGYVIGYILMLISMASKTNILGMLGLEPYYVINDFQIWRIFTWVLMPPQDNLIFAIIMIIFYWQLGTTLERTMGTFKYNCFIFGGLIITVLSAFILFGIYALANGGIAGIMDGMIYIFGNGGIDYAIGQFYSTYYINMSIFLAFALCYPNMQVMLYFIIPIKMKWMAVVYLIIIAIEFFRSPGWAGKVAIIASLMNSFIFFLSSGRLKRISPKEMKRKADWNRATGQRSTPWSGFSPGAGSAARQQNNAGQTGQRHIHKCEICGRTEVTNPNLTFRYCSHCTGNHEYCNDHLFTHVHIKQ